eukprot:TRINITY_DN224_c1_g2_i1.p1 TRINITY_DN224_c1_g2~~TRINITY_DN224_c1_g2_i1.p1  ORF type:complete len:418 (+),score=15.26 TRINITY_DN224_c1_g2_i1:118-1371(+)
MGTTTTTDTVTPMDTDTDVANPPQTGPECVLNCGGHVTHVLPVIASCTHNTVICDPCLRTSLAYDRRCPMCRSAMELDLDNQTRRCAMSCGRMLGYPTPVITQCEHARDVCARCLSTALRTRPYCPICNCGMRMTTPHGARINCILCSNSTEEGDRVAAVVAGCQDRCASTMHRYCLQNYLQSNNRCPLCESTMRLHAREQRNFLATQASEQAAARRTMQQLQRNVLHGQSVNLGRTPYSVSPLHGTTAAANASQMLSASPPTIPAANSGAMRLSMPSQSLLEWQQGARADTFTWLYQPLIEDALSAPRQLQFIRPIGWEQVTATYRTAFASNGITWAHVRQTMTDRPTGPQYHIHAHAQEQLMQMQPVMWNAVSQWGAEVQLAILNHQVPTANLLEMVTHALQHPEGIAIALAAEL